ncbi:hypothetical protein BGZ50_007463 [Haplosporangium sp. Z 11]|nr:hypothetical protein BGZ50_007463 [Haplosporangium sp. Z 11]
MADLKLFCIVDGKPTSRIFSVKIASDETVDDLRKLIKTKYAVEFKDVDANDLTLWQVSIPVTEDDDELPIKLDALNEKKKLEPIDDLSDVFVEKLPKDSIHIIVQRPPREPYPTRTSTPIVGSLSNASRPGTSSTGNLHADIKKISDKFFDPASQYTRFLNEFVQGAYDLPVTEGSISGLPTVRSRGLKERRTTPSLLFFDLPSSVQSDAVHNQAEKILAEYPGTRFLPLFGVSGCGKTRTVMDLLSRSWGLYFNAGPRDYGSSDMHTLARALPEHHDIYLSENKIQNTDRVRYLTYGLLYARLSILEYCLSIAGTRDSFSCQRWMLLQVATPVFEDVFQALFLPISQYFHSHVVPSTIIDIVQERFRSVQKLLRGRTLSSATHSKFLVTLDESQILGRLFSTAFLDGDDKTVRPVLAPILFAFQRIADPTSRGSICVLPCGTGLSSYELTWSEGSASGAKLSRTEYKASKLSGMVVDFAGWTDVDSISTYLARLGQGLNDEARQRLAMLFPSKAVLRLFRDLRGRFRPIVSTIEDIIEADNPMAWEECIHEREDRLMTAFSPTADGEQRRLEGNLCGELRRMFHQVRQGQDDVAFAEFRNAEATLKLAVATFVTQGGYMAFKGQLPKLVETAFGRIKIIDDDFYTTIDEPFALRAADNYFQVKDPDYLQYRCDQLERSSTEATRGKEWEFSIPYEMVRIFHDRMVSTRLFHNADPPHDMFRRRASVVGWSGHMQTTGCKEITMAEFLDAHINNNSERDGGLVPPFLYPEKQPSGPDIVFVVRFSGVALDSTAGCTLTPSPGSTPSDIICPVFVQVKLCKELSEAKAIDARSTVQPKKIKKHGVKISQFCRPYEHYISLVVSYPAEIASYFMDRPSMEHADNLTEIALTIDDSNIDLFSEKHVQALRRMKRLATDMAETSEAVRRCKMAVFDDI